MPTRRRARFGDDRKGRHRWPVAWRSRPWAARGIQVLGPSCLERLRRRKRGHHRWWHRSQEPLMESMETALATALLGVSALPLVGDGVPLERSAFSYDEDSADEDSRPVTNWDDDADDLDFEAAFASY